MLTINGNSILDGIAIGTLRVVRQMQPSISNTPATDPEAELARFEQARLRAIDQQNTLYEEALLKAGAEIAAVFSIHALMLEDEEFMGSIRTMIRTEHSTAEYAVLVSGSRHAAVIAGLDDPYLAARSADIEDVTQSLLETLTGVLPAPLQFDQPFILVAEDLAPSQTIRLDKKQLLGFVTRKGSAASHTAILARSMNIPALVQCQEVNDNWNGRQAILDGYSGTLYLDPTPQMVKTFSELRRKDEEHRALLTRLRGLPNQTKDGCTIEIEANIGGLEDLAQVEENDAAGVGLFRSEFLYLNSPAAPTEDEQFAVYKQVLKRLAPKRVVVRTCDLGADKMPDYMDFGEEINPALGLRGVRFCLTHPDFFKTQLRALLRAACYGNLAVMFPMLTRAEELEACKELLEICRAELQRQGIPTGPVQVGAMIETPAAVLNASEIAASCDFFSIGTNDLHQYLCAMDRQNQTLDSFSDPRHPALLRAVEWTVQAAHRHGIKAAICGELAADPTMTEWFLRIGVDALSVNPVSVLPLREQIREMDLMGVFAFMPPEVRFTK